MNKTILLSSIIVIATITIGICVLLLLEPTSANKREADTAIKPAVVETPASEETVKTLIVPMPSHGEIMQRLKAEATAQKVYFHIWCTAFYEGDMEKYAAIATKTKPFNFYIEDGAEDYWYVVSANSADEAAWALLRKLKEPPNWKPTHRDNRQRAKCMEPISGGPQ